MSATQVGIVYSTVSRMLRYVIIPDNDGQLTSGVFRLNAGESQILVAKTLYNNIGAASCLALHFGVAVNQLPNPRCAVVNTATNMVVGIINADPAVDVPPNAITTKYVNDPNVQVGWKLTGGVLTAPPPPPVNNPPPLQRATIDMQSWAPEIYTQITR